jgi:hypothetical protein
VSTLARNEKREQLRYNYTPDERREKGQQLADTHFRLGAVKDELDRIKSDYKAKIQLHETEISTLSNQVSSGYEMREYVCFYEYDQPEKGKKTLRRKEPPCDVVRVEEMTEADRQTVIESIEKQMEEREEAPGAIVPFVPRNVTPAADEDDELTWAAALENDRKQRAAEDAEKKKASKGKGRRTSSGGVVGTEEDGKDLTTEDDKKNGY